MTHSMIHRPIPAPRPPAATPPAPLRTADVADILLTWNHATGWAHLARHHRGDTATPTFPGRRELPTADPAHLRHALTRAGLRIVSEHTLDAQRTEFRLAGQFDIPHLPTPRTGGEARP